jgi:hypothetical protein
MTKTQTNIDTALKLLDENPQGLHYAELIRKIEASIPGMSRNTISGSIWDLDQTHPDKVYKVSKGLFRLLKYQEEAAPTPPPPPQPHPSVRQIREEDFYQPFADWLVNEVEECSKAVSLGGNRFKDKWQTPDVVGKLEPSRSDIVKFETEIVSAEIKLDDGASVTAFGQACSYKLFSHKSWLVVPKTAGDEDIARLDSLCRIFGIGLVLFDATKPDDPGFTIQTRPVRSLPDMFYTNKYMKLIERELF